MEHIELAQLIAEASDTYAPSQAELAAEIGVRPLALTTWRSGRSRPTEQHLKRMALVFAEQSERLLHYAARLHAAAREQGTPTRSRGTAGSAYRRTARSIAACMVAAGEGRVMRVVFFGSRARGEPRSPASDWDFVVVLNDAAPDPEVEEAWLKRAAADAGGAERVDVWPVDQREWETGRNLHGHPLRTAHKEGVVLYAVEEG